MAASGRRGIDRAGRPFSVDRVNVERKLDREVSFGRFRGASFRNAPRGSVFFLLLERNGIGSLYIP